VFALTRRSHADLDFDRENPKPAGWKDADFWGDVISKHLFQSAYSKAARFGKLARKIGYVPDFSAGGMQPILGRP
jgi:hypothetical protein